MKVNNEDKVAIIFGATGQIGSYLAEHLLMDHQYGKVVGVTRRVSVNTSERLGLALASNRFNLVQGDITDTFSLSKVFAKEIVDRDLKYEIYNLAAASHVHTSFSQPKLYADITGTGHLNVLESILPFHDSGFNIRTYYQASSEMYGSEKDPSGYQTLLTPMIPNSPYGVAKLYAYHINRIYRESYGMWNSCGIIFNTESPRRGEDFVTRKITKWFAKYFQNQKPAKLELGNVHACRDWMHAKDSVRAIHLINNAQRPKDYLVASGETHSVSNFMEECYQVGQDLTGKKCNEKLEDLYKVNQKFFRPNEVPYLKGQAYNIWLELGWKPTISFKELVKEMMILDFEAANG